MRQVLSDQLEDFAAIYEQDVELISVARPEAGSVSALAEQVASSRRLSQLRWMQEVGQAQPAAEKLPCQIDDEARAVLSDQIAEASAVIGELMDCEQVGVRIGTLTSPMCPRFHIDQVPCRMLITLSGAGTEWIANDEVDWAVLKDLGTSAPPIVADGQVRNLTTGHWSLLKGGAWNEEFDGVVHRSPHAEGERLLLSLDPIF